VVTPEGFRGPFFKQNSGPKPRQEARWSHHPGYLLRTWDGTEGNEDTWTILARGGTPRNPGEDYDALQSNAAINSNGDVGFYALTGSGSTDKLLFHGAGNPAGLQYDVTLGSFTAPVSLRPVMDDAGDVLVRAGQTSTSPIILYSSSGAATSIATTAMGFTSIGSSPGISADGKIIVFYGELSSAGAAAQTAANGSVIPAPLHAGAGIFASIKVGSSRYLAEVAATSSSGLADQGGPNPVGAFGRISALDSNSRVAVKLLDDGLQATVVYVGTDTAGSTPQKAIFSTSIDLYADAVETGGPVLVAEAGQAVGDLTVSDLQIYDSVNSKGQVAFWTTDGTNQAVVVGLPQRLTAAQLRMIMPSLPSADANRYIDALNSAMAEFDITTPKRQAAFLAQIAAETLQLTLWEEGVSRYTGPDYIEYTTSSTKPKHQARAQRHGHTSPDDGLKYHGRGPLQLTWKDEYQPAGAWLGTDLVTNYELVSDSDKPLLGFRTAGWFWSNFKGINPLADTVDPSDEDSIAAVNLSITKRVNGGKLGLDTRLQFYMTALDVLGA
jgi:predicted chitinase